MPAARAARFDFRGRRRGGRFVGESVGSPVVDDPVATRRRHFRARSRRPRRDDEGAALSADKLATTSVEVTGKPMEAKAAPLAPPLVPFTILPSFQPSASLGLSSDRPSLYLSLSLSLARSSLSLFPFHLPSLSLPPTLPPPFHPLRTPFVHEGTRATFSRVYTYSKARAERLTDTRRG